jgi:hypothetical protein
MIPARCQYDRLLRPLIPRPIHPPIRASLYRDVEPIVTRTTTPPMPTASIVAVVFARRVLGPRVVDRPTGTQPGILNPREEPEIVRHQRRRFLTELPMSHTTIVS